jgi:hypothetical protein
VNGASPVIHRQVPLRLLESETAFTAFARFVGTGSLEWDQRDRLLGGLLVGGGPMGGTSACGSQGEGDGAKPAVGKARSGQSAMQGVPKVQVPCRRWN